MLTLQQESRDCRRQTTSLDEMILERRESTAESDLFEGSPYNIESAKNVGANV